ncbi:MAG: P1 family peptidase [Clostridia bacterium]|nr:P1 family peptidase [Clostridia bacterium]
MFNREAVGSITDIEGIKVGQVTDFNGMTGCTVVVCENGAIAGVDVRGSAPGTRETDLLRPINLVEKIHAVVLSGGSAFGLDAACGVMQYLEEKGIGMDVGVTKVPIVTSAVLFDLDVGDYRIRPDRKMGYMAAASANNRAVEQGNVGAGTGATVGKILGGKHCMKGGIGTSSISLEGGIKVGALVAVNSFGDIFDFKGNIIAGAVDPDTDEFVNTPDKLLKTFSPKGFKSKNTTIGVVATNAMLNKEQVNKMAQSSQDAYARMINPAHTMYDGDTIFALSTGDKSCDINIINAAANKAMCDAILNAIKYAESIDGVICSSDFLKQRL